jgi:hypothetical protein
VGRLIFAHAAPPAWHERNRVTDEPDIRLSMEYEVPQKRPDPGKCSFCASTDELMITKHRWANRPLGQLQTRCPHHQQMYEWKTLQERKTV